jgi:cytochrome c
VKLDGNGFLISVIAFIALGLAVTVGYFVGAPGHAPQPVPPLAGDPEAGRVALERMGCAACHAIEGVRAPGGRAAPPLNDLRFKRYLAGRLPNTPENAVRFIVDPQGVSPGSAMPNLGVVDVEARNMVAYLYRLGGRP